MKTRFTIDFPQDYASLFNVPTDYSNPETGVQIRIRFQIEDGENFDIVNSLGNLIFAFNKMAGYDIPLSIVESMAISLSSVYSCEYSFERTIELYSSLNLWLSTPYRDYECLIRMLTCLLPIPDYLVPTFIEKHADHYTI